MAVDFILVDRDTPDWFPATVQEYLPEEHLARFVVEIVEQLDLSHLVSAYAGTGSKPYHPEMLVALIFYGYASGVFSSRKLALATHDSIAFRYICANTHPDQDKYTRSHEYINPNVDPNQNLYGNKNANEYNYIISYAYEDTFAYAHSTVLANRLRAA